MPDPAMAAARRSASLRKPIPRSKKPRNRRGTFGVPPPVSFDFDSLSDGTLLSSDEVAAVLRRSKATPPYWRTLPDHPLKWQRVLGKPLYRVGDLRRFIASWTGSSRNEHEGNERKGK
ncbi:hypothetical protein [Bradyrhizobium sp. Ai1a-2]|uniref:hypothetical protein n=1 Tax=Bradyrhizobium sp. Ai1a-2 TaxID=196490 RepID=UPI0003FE3F90|nr:hypothetical protein [Bradyrhizobium sp. Ai1a-2]